MKENEPSVEELVARSHEQIQKEFEVFLTEQVGRQKTVYTVCGWMLVLLTAASVIMFIAGVCMGLSILKGLLLLVLGLGLFASGTSLRNAGKSYGDAQEEMEYGLSHPECNVPDDYEDNTKTMRRETCKVLKSLRGLIIAYGLMAAMMWAATPFLFIAAGAIGSSFDFEPILFGFCLVMPAMAIPLTILAIVCLRDYPQARRFMPQILQVLE